MFAKKNGRVSFRSNKRSNYRKNTNSYLNNKPRAKGNVSQLYEKYFKLAKEASSSGDKIQSEYFYQFADHYARLMNEMGLKSFSNEDSPELINEKKIQSEEKVNEDNEDKEKNISVDESNENTESENYLEESSESIEDVPFIAKPARKKTLKSKKEVS